MTYKGESNFLSLRLSFLVKLLTAPLILDPSPSRGEGKERCIPFPPSARLPRQKTARKDGMGGSKKSNKENLTYIL